MPQLLSAGTHTVQVTEIQDGPKHIRLGFESPDGRTAFQNLPNTVLMEGLIALGVADARQLKGCSCIIRVERASSGPGVELARVTACQWLIVPTGTAQHRRLQA